LDNKVFDIFIGCPSSHSVWYAGKV